MSWVSEQLKLNTILYFTTCGIKICYYWHTSAIPNCVLQNTENQFTSFYSSLITRENNWLYSYSSCRWKYHQQHWLYIVSPLNFLNISYKEILKMIQLLMRQSDTGTLHATILDNDQFMHRNNSIWESQTFNTFHDLSLNEPSFHMKVYHFVLNEHKQLNVTVLNADITHTMFHKTSLSVKTLPVRITYVKN